MKHLTFNILLRKWQYMPVLWLPACVQDWVLSRPPSFKVRGHASSCNVLVCWYCHWGACWIRWDASHVLMSKLIWVNQSLCEIVVYWQVFANSALMRPALRFFQYLTCMLAHWNDDVVADVSSPMHSFIDMFTSNGMWRTMCRTYHRTISYQLCPIRFICVLWTGCSPMANFGIDGLFPISYFSATWASGDVSRAGTRWRHQ